MTTEEFNNEIEYSDRRVIDLIRWLLDSNYYNIVYDYGFMSVESYNEMRDEELIDNVRDAGWSDAASWAEDWENPDYDDDYIYYYDGDTYLIDDCDYDNFYDYTVEILCSDGFISDPGPFEDEDEQGDGSQNNNHDASPREYYKIEFFPVEEEYVMTLEELYGGNA